MLVLSKAIVLCICVVAQASSRVDLPVSRYNSEAKYPRSQDPSPHPSPNPPPIHSLPEKITYTPSTPPTPSPPTPRLSLGAKAGIITACIIVFLLLFLLTLELAYLGRQRRARTTSQTPRENEHGGVELEHGTCGSEVKENVVLESRVEIVVEGEEEEGEGSSAGSWGEGWEADGEEEEDGGVWGRGRNGMSLARKEC